MISIYPISQRLEKLHLPMPSLLFPTLVRPRESFNICTANTFEDLLVLRLISGDEDLIVACTNVCFLGGNSCTFFRQLLPDKFTKKRTLRWRFAC